MNKTQREKLNELEAQIWKVITSARTLLEEEQKFLNSFSIDEHGRLYSEDGRSLETDEDIFKLLGSTVHCLESAVEDIILAKGLADSMPELRR